MENAVFLQLLRVKNENPLMEIYYLKDVNGSEIDFLLKEGTKIQRLIQVCYNIEDDITRKREIKSLINGAEKLNCKNLEIITWDEKREEKIKNKKIKFSPLWEWLIRNLKM